MTGTIYLTQFVTGDAMQTRILISNGAAMTMASYFFFKIAMQIKIRLIHVYVPA